MSTENEKRELYGLRIEISNQINKLRIRYGNKDGISVDGSYRRYDDKKWQMVEDELNHAIKRIFQAEEFMRGEDDDPTVQWCVDAALAAYKRESERWINTSSPVAKYFKNALSLISGPGKFACAKPETHNAQGEPVYLTFRNVTDTTAQARYCTRAEIEAKEES